LFRNYNHSTNGKLHLLLQSQGKLRFQQFTNILTHEMKKIKQISYFFGDFEHFLTFRQKYSLWFLKNVKDY